MTKKKQHCIHECVCGTYQILPCYITDAACINKCKHEERSHPVQSADDVLDELLNGCEHDATVGDKRGNFSGYVHIAFIRRKIKELRQAGEP